MRVTCVSHEAVHNFGEGVTESEAKSSSRGPFDFFSLEIEAMLNRRS